MPHFMARSVMKPLAKARSGPSRSGLSAPFWKSQRSLTRLAVHCISSAKSRQSSAGSQWNEPSLQASAEATMMGVEVAPKL